VSGDPHSPTSAGPAPSTPPSGSFDGPSSPLDSAAERPEVLVGAAFAGGLITAMLLKRLGR
jgi:hypothetical protein